MSMGNGTFRNQPKLVHNLSLNANNFPHINTDVTFGLMSLALITAREEDMENTERKWKKDGKDEA